MSDTSIHLYALAIGSNRPLSARRTAARLIEEAVNLIGEQAHILAVAPTLGSSPMGPSTRTFSNSAILIESSLPPPDLLLMLHAIERALGRKRHRRWGARSMDIDIILWSGGPWRERRLIVPHSAFRSRDFVLRPLVAIAPDWRDVETGLSMRHLLARLKKPRARG